MENLIQIKNPLLRKFQYCIERYAWRLINYQTIKTGSYKRTFAEKIPLQIADYMEDGKPPKLSIPTKNDDIIVDFLKVGKKRMKEVAKEKYFLELINDSYSQKARLALLDEIEENLTQDKQSTTAYIRDVLRWILYNIETTSFDKQSRFFRNIDITSIAEPRSDMYKALLSDLLDVDYNKNSELWLVNGIIELCWWFYDIFHTKCEDYGYNTDEIYKSMYIIDSEPQQTNITQENTEKKQNNNIEHNKNSLNTFLPQQSIIIYENTEKALEVIKETIKGKKGKSACISIRALIKAKVIDDDKNKHRSTIYREIANLTGFYIGTNTSISNYWFDNTLDRQIEKEVNSIIQKLN